MRRQGIDSQLPAADGPSLQDAPRAFSNSVNSGPVSLAASPINNSAGQRHQHLMESSTMSAVTAASGTAPPSPTVPAGSSSTNQQQQGANNNTNTNDKADAPRRRIPHRVYDYTPEDLYDALRYSQADVHAAIDATLVDKYLERMARQQLGDDYDASATAGGGGGGFIFGGGGDDDAPNSPSLSFASRSLLAGGGGGKIVTSSFGPAGLDGGEPPINNDIAPYVRPPKRLNRYPSFLKLLETFVPFGIIIPMAVLCAILVGYMFAKVKLCGYGCECDAGDIALITFTFGLIRDLPCSVVFACLTEACIEHQRSAAQTTQNRRNRANEGGRSLAAAAANGGASAAPPGRGGRGDGFQRIGNSTANSTTPSNNNGGNRYYGQDNTNSRITYEAAHTYGPYVLGSGLEYLRRKRVLALIVAGQLWVMLYRAFATPIGIPAKAQLAILVAVKVFPFVMYAFAKRKVAASSSSCILIVMPILIELITEADKSTHEGENRSLWTGFFPLMVLVVDRFFLVLINVTSHPSRSVGALIIFCTMHAFFIQNMLLGILLTIDASEHGGLVAGYAICFALIEIILNTIVVERAVHACWRALKERFGSGASAKKSLVDPLGKYSVANVAAMVRLPSLVLSFLFMLPAMHFEYYPQKTRAIGCDGRTNYSTSWPTYGVIAGVIIVVGAVTLFARLRKGTSLVPLCVYGITWSLMASFYCLQVVPQSLSFLPLLGGDEHRDDSL